MGACSRRENVVSIAVGRQSLESEAVAVIAPRYLFVCLIVLLIAANIVTGAMTERDSVPTPWLLLPWGITAACMIACFAIIGKLPVRVAGQVSVSDWRSILVDQRNKMSLARLQLVLWSVLVISAALTEGILNSIWGRPEPLNLAIPSQLWIVLGLSSASFVAAPVVLGSKADHKWLHTKAPGQHAWRDIFYGDDTGNADQVDVSKVQQFFFTVLLIISYAVAIGNILVTITPSSATCLSFPRLDPGFVGIMAVSQVAYIAYKAIPQNKTDAPN